MVNLKMFLPRKKRKRYDIGEMQKWAYLAGLAVGAATLYWIYLFVLIVPAMKTVTGPDKPFKVTMALVFGIITPFWLYLPYYLYTTFLTTAL